MGVSPALGAVAAVLQLVAFVFLLLVTISVPVVSGVFVLGSTTDYLYGVFGYCKSGDCTAGYPWTPLNVSDDSTSWAMLSLLRDLLAKILIIAPIAAGFALILLILTIASLFTSYVVGIVAFVASVLAFLTSAVVCIATIMLFYPHVAWTGWLTVGSAAALLVSMVVVLLAIKLGHYDDYNDRESELDDDLTRLEDRFDSKFEKLYGNDINNGNSFSAPQKFGSSIGHLNYQFSNALTYSKKDDSSLYNQPQRTVDVTKPSTGPISGNNNSSYSVARLAAAASSSNEKVSIVNGPNTPVSSKRVMAPHITPNVATPTMNDAPMSKLPQRPYPVSQFLPLVFEHHPEVEGHKPFTELTDDHQDFQDAQQDVPLDLDADSDFTLVSQRGPNPQYYSRNESSDHGAAPPPPPPHGVQGAGYRPQQHLQAPQNQQPLRSPIGHYPQQTQHQQFYQNQYHLTPHSNQTYQQNSYQQNNYQQNSYQQNRPQSNQQSYQQSATLPNYQQNMYQGGHDLYQYGQLAYQTPPQVSPQRQGPSILDNALNNNPDFAVGGRPKRKPGQGNPYAVTRGPGAARSGPYAMR